MCPILPGVSSRDEGRHHSLHLLQARTAVLEERVQRLRQHTAEEAAAPSAKRHKRPATDRVWTWLNGSYFNHPPEGGPAPQPELFRSSFKLDDAESAHVPTAPGHGLQNADSGSVAAQPGMPGPVLQQACLGVPSVPPVVLPEPSQPAVADQQPTRARGRKRKAASRPAVEPSSAAAQAALSAAETYLQQQQQKPPSQP